MSTEFNNGSRSRLTFDSVDVYNMFKVDIDVTALPEARTYIVTSKVIKAHWIIADDVYRQPRLSWFILMYNNIKRPDTELIEGMILRIPSIQSLNSLLDRYGAE